MNNKMFYLLLLLNAFLSAISQVLLKKSAIKKYKNVLLQYLNPYVISSYIIFAIVLVINIIAMRYISISEVSIFSEGVPLVISLFFGYFFFGEKISKRKIVSSLIIVIGILIILV